MTCKEITWIKGLDVTVLLGFGEVRIRTQVCLKLLYTFPTIFCCLQYGPPLIMFTTPDFNTNVLILTQ